MKKMIGKNRIQAIILTVITGLCLSSCQPYTTPTQGTEVTPEGQGSVSEDELTQVPGDENQASIPPLSSSIIEGEYL